MISQTVKKCSVCQRGYPLTAEFCPFDGTSLTETLPSDPILQTLPLEEPPVPVSAADPLIGATIAWAAGWPKITRFIAVKTIVPDCMVTSWSGRAHILSSSKGRVAHGATLPRWPRRAAPLFSW